MAINARVISGSDPGAVPGVSTKTLFIREVWGRNRIDGRLKAMPLPAWAALEAQSTIVANDNFAEGANDNFAEGELLAA